MKLNVTYSRPVPRPKLTAEKLKERCIATPTGCWEWQGAKSGSGYGCVGMNGRKVATHRLAYIWFVGPIPDGLELDHLCRNIICCNPEHLEAVTRAENQRRRRRDVCVRGHRDWEMSGSGHRRCRTCRRAYHRTYMQKYRR